MTGFVDGFVRWLREEAVAGPGSGRVAEDLPRVARAIAEAAGPVKGSPVLDLGAGTGVVALAAADRGAAPTAVDVDLTALTRGRHLARNLGAPVRHVAADARSLPFREELFRASVHRSVLVYMDRPERAVAEEHRVLTPGGVVSCSESLGASLDLRSNTKDIMTVWSGLAEILAQATQESHTFSLDSLRTLYEEAGFAEILVRREEREVPLDSGDAVARAFWVPPPAGLSARDYWVRSGVPGQLVDEFLARLVQGADRGEPALLLAPEGYLTARRP